MVGLVVSLLFTCLCSFYYSFLKPLFLLCCSVWTSRDQWWVRHCLVFPEALTVWALSCWNTTSCSLGNWRDSWLTWKTDARLSDTRTSVEPAFFMSVGWLQDWYGFSPHPLSKFPFLEYALVKCRSRPISAGHIAKKRRWKAAIIYVSNDVHHRQMNV